MKCIFKDSSHSASKIATGLACTLGLGVASVMAYPLTSKADIEPIIHDTPIWLKGALCVSQVTSSVGIIKTVVGMSEKTTKYSNLISVLRALEALRREIPDKQFLLVQMVLYLLDRIFPNQPWSNKLKFLESDLNAGRDHSRIKSTVIIRDEKSHLDTLLINNTILDLEASAITAVDKPFCFKHSRHLVPVQEKENKDPSKAEIVYESSDYDISEMKNSLFLEQSDTELVKMFSSWKEAIQKSKLNKKWIMQEWLAATKFWRIKLLKRIFGIWVNNGSMMAQAHVFRYHNLVDKHMLKIISIFKSRKNNHITNIKKQAFERWRKCAKDTIEQANGFYARNIQNKCFQIILHSFNYRKHLIPVLHNHLKYYHLDLQHRAFLLLKTAHKQKVAEKEKQQQLKSNVKIFKKEKYFYFWFDCLKRIQKLRRFLFIQNQKSLKICLYQWQHEYKTQQTKHREIVKLGHIKTQQLFSKWKHRYLKIRMYKNNLVKIVQLRKKNLFTQRFLLWKHWTEKHCALRQSEQYLVQKRAFKQWRQSITDKKNIGRILEFQKRYSFYYFKQWKMKLKIIFQIKKVRYRQYFSKWKLARIRQSTIRQQITKFQARNIFRKWKDICKRTKRKEEQKKAFYSWKHAYLVKQLKNKNRRKSLDRLFKTLIEKRGQNTISSTVGFHEKVVVAETITQQNLLSLQHESDLPLDSSNKDSSFVAQPSESLIDYAVNPTRKADFKDAGNDMEAETAHNGSVEKFSNEMDYRTNTSLNLEDTESLSAIEYNEINELPKEETIEVPLAIVEGTKRELPTLECKDLEDSKIDSEVERNMKPDLIPNKDLIVEKDSMKHFLVSKKATQNGMIHEDIQKRQHLELSIQVYKLKISRNYFNTWKKQYKEQKLKYFVATMFENVLLKKNTFFNYKSRWKEVKLNEMMIDLKKRKSDIKTVIHTWKLKKFRKNLKGLKFHKWKTCAIESIKTNLILDLYNAKLLMKYFYLWKRDDLKIKFYMKEIKKEKLDHLVSVLLNTRLLFTSDSQEFQLPSQITENDQAISLEDSLPERLVSDVERAADQIAMLHYRQMLLKNTFRAIKNVYSSIITNLNWALLTHEYRTRMQYFIKWKKYLVAIKSDQIKNVISTFKLKNYFRSWYHSYKSSLLHQTAIDYHNQNLVIHYLNIWIMTYNQQILRDNQAIDFHEAKLKRCILKWKTQSIECKRYLQSIIFFKWKAEKRKITFIKRRLFIKWKRNLNRNNEIQTLAKKYDTTRLSLKVIKTWKGEIHERKVSVEKYYFTIWKHKLKSIISENILKMNHHITLKIKQSLFLRWRLKFKTKMRAIYSKYKLFLVARQKIYFLKWGQKKKLARVNSYFRKWKLERQKRLRQEVSARIKLIRVFNHWKFKTEVKSQKEMNMILLRKHFTCWKWRLFSERIELQKLDTFIKNQYFRRCKKSSKTGFIIKRKMFIAWKNRITSNDDLPFLKRFFGKWKTKCAKESDREEIIPETISGEVQETKIEDVSLSIECLRRHFSKWKWKAITKQYFKKWLSSYESNKFDNYRKLLFSDLIYEKQLKKLYFYWWKNRSSILNNIE
ncbi:hypothetical protein HDV06_004795 [Boothiomyces sp. JEL0866]|nr:hypothetical protein HDV06_004795 [Boothiomyces sp. JEL0866]